MSILYDFNDALRTRKVLVPWPAALALKAGAPLDADGAVSNDDDAIGILLKDGDIGKTVVINGAGFIECEIMTSGYLDQDAAEASCGLEYDDDLIAELTGITFVKGGVLHVQTVPESAGTDAGKILTVDEDGDPEWADPVVQVFDIGVSSNTLDKTWQEAFDALSGGKIVRVVESEDDPSAPSIRSTYVLEVSNDGVDFTVYATGVEGAVEYVAASASGYPAKAAAAPVAEG